ncbi:hypothetical protein ACFRAQ_07285 [Nocardia sp. NPDC056611]|uniref:hypothetical protein n=1 Tax=Nocardia sp. NPDC056611 TaxID=3345877 RepID=UPI0036703236
MFSAARSSVGDVDGEGDPAADGGSIIVSDDAGQIVAQLPLAFALNGIRYDIRHDISAGGRTLDLALDLASAQPIASPQENQLAANESLGSSVIRGSVELAGKSKNFDR